MAHRLRVHNTLLENDSQQSLPVAQNSRHLHTRAHTCTYPNTHFYYNYVFPHLPLLLCPVSRESTLSPEWPLPPQWATRELLVDRKKEELRVRAANTYHGPALSSCHLEVTGLRLPPLPHSCGFPREQMFALPGRSEAPAAGWDEVKLSPSLGTSSF